VTPAFAGSIRTSSPGWRRHAPSAPRHSAARQTPRTPGRPRIKLSIIIETNPPEAAKKGKKGLGGSTRGNSPGATQFRHGRACPGHPRGHVTMVPPDFEHRPRGGIDKTELWRILLKPCDRAGAPSSVDGRDKLPALPGRGATGLALVPTFHATNVAKRLACHVAIVLERPGNRLWAAGSDGARDGLQRLRPPKRTAVRAE
jgi:hypothetical protein